MAPRFSQSHELNDPLSLWAFLCTGHFADQNNNYTRTPVKGVLLISACLQHLFHSLTGRCLMLFLSSDTQEPLLCRGLLYNSMPITERFALHRAGRVRVALQFLSVG